MDMFKKNIKVSLPLVVVICIIFGGTIVFGKILGWQSDRYSRGFSTQGGESLEYGPFVYTPLTLYVTLDDAIPNDRTMKVQIRYGYNFDQTWEISEGSSTPSVYPNGEYTYVYVKATEPFSEDYDVVFTIHFYD